MSISFVRGAEAVELPDPLPGQPASLLRHQAVGRTAAGAVYVYDKGVTRRELVLRFGSLSAAQRTALEGFFDTVAQGARNSFTYTDVHGDAFTARFLDSSLAFVKVADDVWTLVIRLELDSEGG